MEPAGAGGFLSTVEDMYRWHLALKNNLVLSEASQRKATTPYALTERPQSYYGYAWFIPKTPDGKLLAEHGGDGMFMAEFRRYRGDDTVLVLGINHRSRDAVNQPVRRQTIRLLTDAEYKLPPKAEASLPPFYRFAPRAKAGFVSYNFATSTEVNINFRIGVGGAVTALTYSGGADNLMATKVGK